MATFTIPRIRVHALSFALLAVVACLRGGTVAGALWFVLAVAVLFLFVLLHELAHCVAAAREGVPAHEILLTPIGGMAKGPPPPSPSAEIIIAAAGPALSLTLAAWMFGWLAFFRPESVAEVFSFSLDGGLAMMLFKLNMFLAVFNLLPAFPMDGGRILRGVLSLRMGHLRATSAAVIVGAAFAGAMAVYGAMAGHWFLVAIAVFVFLQGQVEKRVARATARMSAEREPPEPWALPDWRPDTGGFPPAGDVAPPDRKPGRLARALAGWRARGEAAKQTRETEARDRVEALLAKISRDGMDSLTPSEQKFLKQASRYYTGE